MAGVGFTPHVISVAVGEVRILLRLYAVTITEWLLDDELISPMVVIHCEWMTKNMVIETHIAIRVKKPLTGKCNRQLDSDCCKPGDNYTTCSCSPPVSKQTKATLTISGFEKGEDGGGPAECDRKYHSNDVPVVALSTGWFNHRRRCMKNITIYGNGRKVNAMVVDECDSAQGCDAIHAFHPPCPNNIVDASEAVWRALQVPKRKWGQFDVFWSDA